MPFEINPNAFYTVDEVADLLGRHKETIKRYCRDKVIPGAKKAGREWIISGKSLIEYLTTEDNTLEKEQKGKK